MGNAQRGRPRPLHHALVEAEVRREVDEVPRGERQRVEVLGLDAADHARGARAALPSELAPRSGGQAALGLVAQQYVDLGVRRE